MLGDNLVNPLRPVGRCPSNDFPYPELLPDENDCGIYYKCTNGHPVKVACYRGTAFDYIYKECIATNARCYKKMKTIHPYSPVGECPDQPGEYPVYLPDSENCSIFYECNATGFPIPLKCSPGLEFNPVLDVCDWPEQAGCTAGSSTKKVQPYSPVGKCPDHEGQYPVYLPDSEDCTIFYECNAIGNPIKLKCPAGTEFNPVIHVCDWPENAGCTAGSGSS